MYALLLVTFYLNCEGHCILKLFSKIYLVDQNFSGQFDLFIMPMMWYCGCRN